MNTSIDIPRGKKLIILDKAVSFPVSGGPMLLDEDIQFTLSSTFSPVIQNAGNIYFNLIGGLIERYTKFGVSGQFKEFGFQVWESTDPLSFSPTVSFYMDTNAKTDVYDRAIDLVSLPLPTDARKGEGIGLIGPGPSVATVLGAEVGVKRGKELSMQVGNILYVGDIIVKKAEPVFSTDTDENGYPIWAKVRLDIISLTTATVYMIKTRYKG